MGTTDAHRDVGRRPRRSRRARRPRPRDPFDVEAHTSAGSLVRGSRPVEGRRRTVAQLEPGDTTIDLAWVHLDSGDRIPGHTPGVDELLDVVEIDAGRRIAEDECVQHLRRAGDDRVLGSGELRVVTGTRLRRGSPR